MKVMNDDLQMRSDWLIPICQGDERIKVNGQKAHSTQKPAELLFRIILSTSNPDDIVLDPFSGSGTTAAVAKRLGRKYIAFEREPFYIKVANERLEKIKPLDKQLLEYRIEKRKPKVPFGCLIEKGYVKIGENLFSRDGKYFAQVQADASLSLNGIVGSIHKISATILKKENHNGWTYWYVKRQNGLISIDQLRHDYESKFLKTKSDDYKEIQFENNLVHEREESFLAYGNNGIQSV
jgi:site-specific DNA-methyltransferase (adenine-specific)/modification methylase